MKYLVNISLSDKILETNFKVKTLDFYLKSIANGGIIGRDFMKNKIVEINYTKHKIYFLHKVDSKNQINKIPFYHNAYTSPYIHILVNGVKINATLDTGYSNQSRLGFSVAEQSYNQLNINEFKEFNFYSYTKHDNITKQYFSAKIEIANFINHNYKIGVQKTYKENLLGNYFFQDYTITFDFVNNMFYFEN